MRKAGGILVVTVFVLLAAVLGWYLPLAAFSFDDTINERKHMELDIERVNLTYRNDLSIAQKIEIANSEYLFEDYMEMERGIFIQQDEVISIVSDFLTDFTGYRYDVNNAEFYAVPILVNLTYNRGTIVFWMVSCWIETDWNFNFGIDAPS